MKWDPKEYLRFADERGRPFSDLLARVSYLTLASSWIWVAVRGT